MQTVSHFKVCFLRAIHSSFDLAEGSLVWVGGPVTEELHWNLLCLRQPEVSSHQSEVAIHLVVVWVAIFDIEMIKITKHFKLVSISHIIT